MGCSFSGLNAIYGAAGGTGEVWVNDNRFRILKQIGGTDASSTVFLVKENLPDGASGLAKKKSIDPSHISVDFFLRNGSGSVSVDRSLLLRPSISDLNLLDLNDEVRFDECFLNAADGTYAMKKFMIHSKEQLELVKQEIRVSSQFNHPNLLPLLDHAIISVKGKEDGLQNYEAYLLFPVHLDGTLSELTKIMQAKNEFFPTITVLQIFRQLCAGLKHMHSFDPPHAHNDVRPENVLITQRKGQEPLAMLMDFESARPARRSIRSQSEASQLQEWATEHCSSLYRAPELWDVPSNADIDERTDIWSLGCTLYAIMYGKSPFDYEIDESEGGLKSAVKSAQIKWVDGPNPAYPDPLRQFITWMLQPQPAIRPTIDDIIIHVDKLIVKYSS